MNFRRRMFFVLDKNKEVHNQLVEIMHANTDEIFQKELHERCIKNLINHVQKTVPFYKNMNLEKFEDIPIVNKIMMKEDISKFRSNAELRIGKVRHTSGSTGIPFEILQDVRKAKRIQAELIYYRELTGDELGTKFINLVSPSRIEKSNKLSQVKQNVIAFDVTKMDNQTMENLHEVLMNNHHINYMMGYASALEKIANYFEEKGYQSEYSLKAIVSSSEILTDKVLEKLNRIFGCLIYDRYSNEDNGFIAQTDGKSRDFLVNRGSYYIEVLKIDSDQPALENEIGRIVITDYYNFAQPFLRYDTGDLGAYAYKNINGVRRLVLTKLAGRISDIVYDMENKPVSTFAIGCALEVFSEIKQYQLIQKNRNEFLLNIIDPLKKYEDYEYKKVLEEVLGKGILLSIKYLDKLPILNSGKFRRVICEYKPEDR